MARYEVTITVNVWAHRDIEVEADTPEAAKELALAEDEKAHKAGADINGVSYDVEWAGREDLEVTDWRELP